MSLLQKRGDNREAILEGRFIKTVLERNGQNIDAEIDDTLSSFSSPFWGNRSFSVDENKLIYRHLAPHRFINMKTRATKTGVKRKKSYKTHNQPLYGHANEIVKDLVVGFTDSVRAEMMKLDDTEI